ncbi:MAG TPA: thioredoxin family protein [Limnochordales bacterium]
MPMIGERDRQAIRSMFEKLDGRVVALVFSEQPSRLVVPGERNCMYCRETVQLVQELAEAAGDGKVQVEVYDRRAQPEMLEAYGVDRVPAIVVTDPDRRLRGVRYFGIPAGYEFTTLVESMMDVASGQTRLSERTRKALASLRTPVHLKVFVTPTCPYCPKAVRLAHQFAMENPQITADMIEATEFPELAQQYGVRGVPRTVINETEFIEGAVPENYLLQVVLTTVGLEPPAEEGAEDGQA